MSSAVPYITDILYDGSQLQVTWTPSSDSNTTGYVIDVAYGNGTVVLSQTFQVTWSTSTQPITEAISLDNGAFNNNTAYFVTVTTMWGNTPGQNETSQPATLITQLPQLLQSYYDGTDLFFEWIPTLQATQGYILQAVQGTQTYYGTISSPSAGSGKIPGSQLTLSTSLPCSVSILAAGYIGENNGNGGQVTASSASITLPPIPASGSAALTVNSAAYQRSTGLTAGWTALAAAANIVSYQLVVTSPQDATDAVINIASGTANTGVLPLPQGLSPNQSYNLRVIALNASGGGLASALIPLVSTVPQLNSVVYSATPNIITLGWNALSNSSVSSYNLVASPMTGSGSSVTGTATGGSATTGTITLSQALSATLGWAVQVSAVSGIASAVGEWAPVYVVSPNLQQISCDGTEVTLVWTPVSAPYYQAPSGYCITLTPASGGAAINSAFISGSQASSGKITLPSNNATCNVQVALVNGYSSGPFSAAVAPILTAPVLSGVVTDAVTGQMTISWGTVPGASNYQLLFNNGLFIGSSATTGYLVPSTTLMPNVPLSVTLGATGTSNTVSLLGPVSRPFAIPTALPLINAASYNGSAATVSWQAVAGASSYTVTILAKTGSTTVVVGTPVQTSNSSAQVVFSANSGAVYSSVVQANMGSYAGPVSTAAELFCPGLFVSQTSATTIYPFTYPATLIGTVLANDAAKTGELITLYLPQIASGSGLNGLPITQGAFTLAANTGSGSAQYPYTLSVSNIVATNNPWSFGIVKPAIKPAAVRDGLRSDYVTFLQKLETGSSSAWGVQYVQQILGRLLPQTFAELLYYNYGLSFPDPTAGITLGSIDLRPGMVLRIAASPFQLVPGQTVTANSWLDGFVGGPVLDYDFGSTISNTGSWGTGFDAFVSQLVMNGAMTVGTPTFNRTNNSGPAAADVTDLYYSTFAGPFYRMFAPSSLLPASNSSGSITIANNFVIAPASSYTNLCATTNILAPAGNNLLAYFRGRAVLKLCIRVSFNGMERLVPLGTTVGNLLEQAGGQPPSVASAVNNVSLMRNLAGAVCNPTAPVSAASYYPVRLDWSNPTPAPVLYGPGWGPLAMPLLAGDRITVEQ